MRNNITREDLDRVIAHLSQPEPRLTHGERVRAFEREWSDWLGVKYSVLVNSGASANLLTLALLREQRAGGEVILPPSSLRESSDGNRRCRGRAGWTNGRGAWS